MESSLSRLAFVSFLLLFASHTAYLAAKKPLYSARNDDIPYIKCQVCEKLALELHNQVHKKQTQISPKKVSEFEIIEIVENVCNLKKEEADWILKIDIVEQGDELALVDQVEEGQCNTECKTIEKACQQIVDYRDTDIAEYMYSSNPNLNKLTNHICKDLSNACSKTPPPIPKNRTPGEPFVPKPSKDAEMDKILRSMEGMPGAPGMKMYSRDELMGMKNFGNEDDDDEEDEESDFGRNLAKAMKAKKKTAKKDWKKTIVDKLTNARATVRYHAHKLSKNVSKQARKLSKRVNKWWSRKKTTKSKSEL